ncbi:hypothetical protein [Kitasatospora sp. NBC_01287]|nr:hypothetical protein [Kitasatospora sp. NBC_01287]
MTGSPVVLGVESRWDGTGAGLVRDEWLPGRAVGVAMADEVSVA